MLDLAPVRRVSYDAAIFGECPQFGANQTVIRDGVSVTASNNRGSKGFSPNVRNWDSAVGHRYKFAISTGSKMPAAICRSMKSLVEKTAHLSLQAEYVRNGSIPAIQGARYPANRERRSDAVSKHL
jgi:hypothetical protein